MLRHWTIPNVERVALDIQEYKNNDLAEDTLHTLTRQYMRACSRTYCILLMALLLLSACADAFKKNYTPRPRGVSVAGFVSARHRLDRASQRQFDEYFLEAVRHKQAGRLDAAYELLNRALAINPDASEALYELARIKYTLSPYSDSTEIAEADSMLGRAVALEPSNRFYREMLAQRYAMKGDFARSIALYERLVADKPTSEGYQFLVQLYEAKGDYEGAVDALTRLETIDGPNEAYSIEKFKIYNEKGDTVKAYGAIEALCSAYPNDLRYRVVLGDMYMQNDKTGRAFEIYTEVLDKEPDNPYAQLSMMNYYHTIGDDSLYLQKVRDVALNPSTQPDTRTEVMRRYAADVLSSGGDSTLVLSLFEQVLDYKMESPDLAEICAFYMMALQMPQSALEKPMRAILRDIPDYTRARLQLLQILIANEDTSGVIALCTEGQVYTPGDIVYYYYEGVAHLTEDDDKAALAAFERGVTHVDEDTDAGLASELYSALGDMYHQVGNAQKAYDAYDRALAYQGDNDNVLNNYAYYLSVEGRELDRAEQMSRRTVERHPDNATYLDTYAWILYQKKQYTQAQIYIDETLKYTETPTGVLLEHAGDIYWRVGEKTAALEFWRKALKKADNKAQKSRLQKKIRNRKL